jgi:chromosome segregation ATPase
MSDINYDELIDEVNRLSVERTKLETELGNVNGARQLHFSQMGELTRKIENIRAKYQLRLTEDPEVSKKLTNELARKCWLEGSVEADEEVKRLRNEIAEYDRQIADADKRIAELEGRIDGINSRLSAIRLMLELDLAKQAKQEENRVSIAEKVAEMDMNRLEELIFKVLKEVPKGLTKNQKEE